jgi:predicted ABC-type ATPase
MSLACPNKSSKEWKMLVSQTGEDLANLAFVANGYRIPDVKPITDIKKAIGFKPNVENFAGIANKLRRFNQANGTSHYFVAERAWGNTFNLTLKYNYLPVNVEKQRQRMAAKGDPLYAVNEFDADNFSIMYPIDVAAVKPKPVTKPDTASGEQLNLFSTIPQIPGALQQASNFDSTNLSEVYFDGKEETTAEKMLNVIAEKNSVMSPIAKHLLQYSTINNAKIVIAKNVSTLATPDRPGIQSIGRYTYDTNTITIPEFIDNAIKKYREPTIIHEILHAFSHKALKDGNKYTKAFQRLYEESLAKLGGFDDQTGTGEYANYTIDEFFVALFTNGQFISKLQQTPPINAQEFNNLLEEIFAYILSSLNLQPGTSLYSQAFAVATNILEYQQDIVESSREADEAYEKYLQSKEYQEALEAENDSFKDLFDYDARTDEALRPNVILPIGTSGSGKSTWINSVNANNEFVVISPDEMRVEFTGNMNDKSKDAEIYQEAAARTVQAIRLGKPVIFDTTNLTKDKRRPFIQAIKNQLPNANIQYKLLPLNPELAKARIKAQLARGENRANVSDATIDRHAESYKQMLIDIKEEPISEYQETESRTDELIARGYTQVEAVEKKRENKINAEIIKQRQLLATVKNGDELNKIMNRIEKLKQQADEAESRVIVSKKINAFEDVLLYGDKQLSEIENLLANSAVSADDAYYAQRVLDLWRRAGDFSTRANEHIILDEDEFNTPPIRSKFRELAFRAEDLQNRLSSIQEEHVTDFVRQFTDSKLTTEDIYKHLADVHKIGATTLNLSRHDDPMMQAAFLAVEQANIRAQQEAANIWKDLDELGKKFLKKSGGNYNILKQLTEDGKETGRVVHRFSSEFFDMRNDLLNKAFRSKDSAGKVKKDPEAVKNYFNWINKNTITFDVRALFPDSELEGATLPTEFIYNRVTFNEEAKQEHIAALKKELGEKGYQFYIEQAQKKIEEFKVRRQAKYESIKLEPGLSQDEKTALFNEWLKEYSPYWSIDMQENPSQRSKGKGSYYSPKGVREYGVQVPRKTIGGVETKWYDKNFARIEADPDLLNYHNYLMETLNQMRYLLPQQKKALMGVGILPTIKKSLMDKFAEKGMMIGIAPFVDKMKQLQTTTDFSRTVYSDINPLTGVIEKDIQIQYIADTNEQVRDIVKQMKIEHQQKTGKPATHSEIKKFREAAKDMLSKQKSWDVTMLLKAYSLEVLSHKHKSFIEPQIKLLDQAFKARKEMVTNKAGEPQKLPSVEGAPEQIATKETGPPHLQSAWDFFFDSTYYSIGARKVEGVTKKKLYTAEEKKQKADLEALIEKETDPQNKEFLQRQLDNLGGFRTGSGMGDALLKYMTLKGLGWNFFSGASNIGFGVISNLIEASGGKNYSMSDYRNAMMLVTNSIGRNISFNTWEGVNSNAVKIRTLMDKWDLNSTSTKELFDMSNKSSMSKLQRFGPFSIQERSEYLNIAPIMVAVMLSENFSATDPDGNQVTLWEAYDINTGTLKKGYTSDVDEVKLVQKIKRIVEMNHGDYYNQLQVKETFAGRALSQFRTWMFEGFANRFESEKVDYALSYGLDEPYIRKGRYRSYSKGQVLTATAAIGTVFLPGVGTALGAGIGYLIGQGANLQVHENLMSDVLYTLKQLARKLMFSSSRKTAFEDKFSKTDAANMRKNMTELYLMLTLMGIAMVLKAMADDEDEDDTISNFLINQTVRLRTDISFYTNPMEIEKLTKTALPMSQLLTDVAEVFTDIGNFYGEDANDKSVFQSGTFKGQPKWLIHLLETAPGTSMLIRWYRTGDKVLE